MTQRIPGVTSALIALGLTACGGSNASAPPPTPAANVAPTAGEADPVLGMLDGQPIHQSELTAESQARLRDMDNEAQQRRLHLLWAGFEDAIGGKLIANEAKRRGISVEALRQEEIDAKVAPTSDDEMRAIYEQNKQVIGVSYDEARPLLERELHRQRLEEQEQAFIESLRQKSEVRYTLPAPPLPRIAMDVGEGARILGPESAKVTLLTFSDFQCPYCARARHLFERLHELYPNDLRIIFRDFPLQQHPDARTAARAGVCAGEQGKFWTYHDLLFDHATALAAADLERYAKDAGLDVSVFDACLASTRPDAAIRAAEEAGKRMGVEGTPAIFINGMKLVGLLPLPLMQSLIDRELTAAR
jgi:protein-disulfide isomerase